MRSLAEQVYLVEQFLLLQGHDVCLRGSEDAATHIRRIVLLQEGEEGMAVDYSLDGIAWDIYGEEHVLWSTIGRLFLDELVPQRLDAHRLEHHAAEEGVL